jgi:ABC-2 type transport system ATP-binding protein
MIEELRAMPGVEEAQLVGQSLKVTTQSGENVIPQIINMVSQCCDIREISMREPNLDEVFLHLTGTALRD